MFRYMRLLILIIYQFVLIYENEHSEILIVWLPVLVNSQIFIMFCFNINICLSVFKTGSHAYVPRLALHLLCSR